MRLFFLKGEPCMMKNGLTGMCQPLADCSDSVNKAVKEQAPVVCNFDSDSPVVCCAKQNRRGGLYRYRRQDKPWWLGNNPFTATTTKPENLYMPWWLAGQTFIENRVSSHSTLLYRENVSTSPAAKPDVSSPTTRMRETPPTNSQRICEIKCNEYSKLATPELVRIDVTKCGFNRLYDNIAGGDETEPKEFPHMAALGYKDGGNVAWRCGGSLISEYYVLTAAHCTPKANPPIIARLGEWNLKHVDDGAAPVNYFIAEKIPHPDYKPPAKYNDIALLKLDRKVEFNDFIRPACLYTRDQFDFDETVATGWGSAGYAERKSDKLNKVAVSIIDNKQCNDLYSPPSEKLSEGILPTMMCAGELKGGKDTCQGDSGGPIQITMPNSHCIYNIIGVTSFGMICAAENAPGVYTRVSAFIPWIESTVWPDL